MNTTTAVSLLALLVALPGIALAQTSGTPATIRPATDAAAQTTPALATILTDYET